MSGEDGFLTRWSRRKAEARVAPPENEAASAVPPGSDAEMATEAPPAPAVPDFDLASLPSLESITAATDISVFMRAGVPEALRNAALRRMWTADPAIRDYVGLSEYAWDFNTPGAISGFGEIAPGTDVAKIVRDIMDGTFSVPVPEVEREARARLESALPEDAPDVLAEADQVVVADANPEIVPQIAPLRPRRRHGGATPG